MPHRTKKKSTAQTASSAAAGSTNMPETSNSRSDRNMGGPSQSLGCGDQQTDGARADSGVIGDGLKPLELVVYLRFAGEALLAPATGRDAAAVSAEAREQFGDSLAAASRCADREEHHRH